MMLTPYHAPKWLIGAHMQTIWPAKIVRVPTPNYHREYLPTPDKQTVLACDFIFSDTENSPLIIMFHGLEGSSSSHYAKSVMTKVKQQNLNGVVVHFRGCGGVKIKGERAYHAGDSAEICWVLRYLKQRFGEIYAIGVSLGGNMLAKYLGETQNAADCTAAAIISAPLDMVAASEPMGKGLGKNIYTRDFLRTLKPKAYSLWQENHGKFDWNAVKNAKTFAQFDSAFTAPLHGFKDAFDYWTKSSAKQFLKEIRIPTLILNAKNDPFMPWKYLPNISEVSNFVELLQPQDGGHVGFTNGHFPGNIDWLPETILHFFGPLHKSSHQ